MNKKHSKVAAVVVTYNRYEMLKQCLSYLKKQSYPCDILIINNASSDETANFLNDYIKENTSVFVNNLPDNCGGAGGFNKGMVWALEAGYDYVWVMDDDCFPNPDALEKLLEANQKLKGEYGWLSSIALWTDGKECKMNRQKLRKDFYKHIELMPYNLIAAEQATFVSCFFSSKIIYEVGLPISDFFIWGDDIEYTRRISVRFHKDCFVCGNSVVVHAMNDNNGSNLALDDIKRINRYNYAFRNENYLYRKEGFKGFCYYSAKCGLNVIRILFKAKNKRLKRCWIVIKQYFAGLFFNPKVEYVNNDK